MSINAKLAINILWLIADRGVRLLIAFFVGVWVARSLGPNLYGAFSYAQATASMLGFLSTLGIEAIVVKQLVDFPDAKKEILGTALSLRLLGGFLAVVVVLFIAVVQKSAHPFLIIIAPLIAAASLLQSFDVIDLWMRVALLSRYSVIARIVSLIAGAVLRISAINTSDPLVALAIAIFLEAVVLVGCLLITAKCTGVQLGGWRVSASRAREILISSSPIIISGIAVAVYSRFSIILLGNYCGQKEIGIFSVATVIAEAFHIIPTAVLASYGPILFGYFSASRESFSNKFLQLLRISVPFSMILCLCISWLSTPLISILFGENYLGSGPVLKLLIWSIIFVYISVVSEVWFIAHGAQRYLLPKTLIAAICSVLLNLCLVPAFGAVGAAITTLISYSVTAFWANALFPMTRPLFLQQLKAMIFWGLALKSKRWLYEK